MISIHAAREGGDHGFGSAVTPRKRKFQSTPPVKAATSMVIYDLVERRISIHAAREGGDGSPLFCLPSCLHFNPRRP